MDVILIAGFWLNASSWDGVVPALEAAGHRVHALTLPGLASIDDDRTGVGLADHVAAVVKAIDDLDGSVVLVGHSGGVRGRIGSPMSSTSTLCRSATAV